MDKKEDKNEDTPESFYTYRVWVLCDLIKLKGFVKYTYQVFHSRTDLSSRPTKNLKLNGFVKETLKISWLNRSVK